MELTTIDTEELAALRKDAERYRWLRVEIFNDEIPRVQSISTGCIGCTLEGVDLDSAVDAAMTAEADL